ncbi:MAG: ATP-binding protein [Lachnospiraceae bacterium]|nr:ATP-binding protein [Lachnospiraceae bacterium]
MVTNVKSATIHGIEACIVTVETDIGDGLPSFDMVGLLSSEVREARERVRTALKNSGFTIPPKRITINLAPADLRKMGTYFDLPIAISILTCIGVIPEENVAEAMFIGELGLDGHTVRVNGVLPIVLKAMEQGMKRCFIPEDNLSECTLASGIEIIPVCNLNELVLGLVSNEFQQFDGIREIKSGVGDNFEYDFADVLGQVVAKRAAEITAAGMHNMLMIGTPGAGKTMIAKCMPSIMPAMSEEEKLEVAGIYSVAGMLEEGKPLLRPFRSPHHTASLTSLTGGGLNPKPGEFTLAHRGVLFFDELPEFQSRTIELLRQPLEDRCISISRMGGKYVFPSDFIFLGASNPCKCGYYPDRTKCKCSEIEVKKYMGRISGPIMDRIDLCVHVLPVRYVELNSREKSESSGEIRKRVEAAVEIQKERYRDLNINYNSQLDGRQIKDYCPLGKKETALMKDIFENMNMSVRSYHRVIKVSRTIADLCGDKEISTRHIYEAMAYRIKN